jgi:D-alanyl-D-alanine carboxypeptidase
VGARLDRRPPRLSLRSFGRILARLHCETGYTEASGYNLVSSVRRDEKHIVAVVLGGTSNAARDARMRQLIEDNISLASTQRTVPVIVEANGQYSADQEWALYFAAQRLKDFRTPRDSDIRSSSAGA